MKRIAIIGAGASGLMAMASILESNNNCEIILIDSKDKIGSKIYLTGGGRCNLTTSIKDIDQVLSNYPRGNQFLKYSFQEFSPQKVREWFENHGVKTKVEKNNKVYPCSDRASEIVNVFQKIIDKNISKIKIFYNAKVNQIEKRSGGFNIILNEKEEINSDCVIIATGGGNEIAKSNGYGLAKSLGHHIIDLKPGLTALISDEKWLSDLSGISVLNTLISVEIDKKHFDVSGDMLFTSLGISGPAVFAMSSLLANFEFSKAKPLELNIDLLPDIYDKDLEEKLYIQIQENPKKYFQNTLANFVSKPFAKIICENLLNLPEFRNNSEVGKKLIAESIKYIRSFPIKIIGRKVGEEFVMVGGVNTDEINPQTMESKLVKGLYFAGEVMNIDGFTGGFNLQAAWATGKVAGQQGER